MNLNLRETASGVVLPVRVSAGARCDGLRGSQAGVLKLSMVVAPEEGKANKAVIKLLAARLQWAPSRIQVLFGATSARKELPVQG